MSDGATKERETEEAEKGSSARARGISLLLLEKADRGGGGGEQKEEEEDGISPP